MIQSVSYRKAALEFKKIFGLDLRDFIDFELGCIPSLRPDGTQGEELLFDLNKFEKTLYEMNPLKEGSIHDIVFECYGQKGVDLIKGML